MDLKIDAKTVALARGFHVNENVTTEAGAGVVQGLKLAEDGAVVVMVSHSPKLFGLMEKRMWVLKDYAPEEVKHAR